MNSNKDEKLITAALNALDKELVVPDLLSGIRKKLDSIGQGEARPNHGRKPVRLLVALAVIITVLGITTAAASFGGFDWLLEKIKLPFGDEVITIKQSTQLQGIKFTVLAAQNHSDMAVLYATLEDVENLGRVTEDTQIGFESTLEMPSIFPEMIYFDKDTDIAAYQIRLITREALDKKSFSMQIDGLRYGKVDLGEIRMSFELAKAVAEGERIGTPPVSSVEIPNEFLIPGNLGDIPKTKFAWISAIGINQDYVTVQFGQPAGIGRFMDLNDIHPFFLDVDGNRTEPKPWKSGFQTNAQLKRVKEGQQAEYNLWEYYFEVEADKLDDYTLCFEGAVWNTMAGNWKLNVNLDSVQTVQEKIANITIDNVVMNNVVLAVNPFGMTLTGNDAANINYAKALMSVTILETTNGDIELEGISGSRTDPNGTYEIIWYAPSTIDLSSVVAIRIGDNRIEL